MAESDFLNMVLRVRQGDEAAASELVRIYEPHVRRVVRIRLTDPGLRRQIDTLDVCQSVMGDFFVRAALGQFDLQSPEQLIRLLATMARNKLINQVHHHQAARRDIRRLAPVSSELVQAVASEATPSQIASGRELLAACRSRLSDEELYLADQRAQGRSWPALAEELGGSPDTLRMRLTRALNRVARELGLEELSDG